MARIEYSPELVEEAVFLALRSGAGASTEAYEVERDPLYRLEPAARRERAFRELAARWFSLLDLAGPLREALATCPWVDARVGLILVRRARRAREEGSELFLKLEHDVEGRPAARIVLAVVPERFATPAKLREIGLRELLHAEDMLDPSFGYRPELPRELEEDLARTELVRDRLAVLWEARVAGRMARQVGRDSSTIAARPGFRRAFAAASHAACAELHASAASGTLATWPELEACALSAAPPASECELSLARGHGDRRLSAP